MRQKFILLFLGVVMSGMTLAQIFPSDSIKFIRYIEDTEKSVNIPMTRLYFLQNTTFKSKSGWILENDLKKDSTRNLVLIDMSSSDVPPGEWSKYSPGSFLLAFELDKNINEIKLDSINAKIFIINNYAGRGVNDPINTATGLLKFQTLKNGQVKINGTITVKSIKPTTKHEITFINATIPTADYKTFVQLEKDKNIKQEQQQKKMFDLTNKIAETEIKFYDSLFNYKLYPANNLKAGFKSNSAFEFKLDRSYIIEDADISDLPSENLMDLLSSNIFYPVQGKSVVINLHHFFEGEKSIIDDETNYSILIALPDLKQGEYLFKEKSAEKAKLGYWHYGPSGHVIESKSVIGKIVITKIENQIVFGTVNLDFKSTDKKSFNINGEFQLPILDKLKFAELGQEIEGIIENNRVSPH